MEFIVVCLAEFIAQQLSGAADIRLYMFAHSLGGLVARCAAPSLLEREPRLVPIGLCTLVSPHLGVARPGGTSIFSAKSLWKLSTEHGERSNFAPQYTERTPRYLSLSLSHYLSRCSCKKLLPTNRYFE
jgi:alpha-beta hydrolase superfamily lysophospholipase